jgi:hypothetical protein
MDGEVLSHTRLTSAFISVTVSTGQFRERRAHQCAVRLARPTICVGFTNPKAMISHTSAVTI